METQTHETTPAAVRKAVTSLSGNSRTRSPPSSARRFDHCASWREGRRARRILAAPHHRQLH
ncbi:MAG: hypothetical protein ACJ8CB_36645 [Ktedonobacteraceae bacterium]